MTRKGFKELIVWQRSFDFFFCVIDDVQKFPKHKISWNLSDNLLRAANSLSVNIAEGHGRRTGPEFKQFLGIAKGSVSECVDQYLKIEKLGWLPSKVIENRLEILSELDKMLRSFIYKLG